MWKFLALENKCGGATWHFDSPFNNIIDAQARPKTFFIVLKIAN
jgi:hypothetical protein